MQRADPSPDQIAHQRRIALFGAALVAPFALLDAAQGGTAASTAAALGARLAWVAGLLAGAALLSGRSPRPPLAAGLMAWTTAGAVIAIVTATGGTESGYFAFLLALPFCMQILLPGHLVASTAGGAAGIAAGAILLARADASAIDLARWIGTGVGASVVATYASHVGGGLFRRELTAARDRAEAAAALARSEQRRATSERLAVVGRLAAGVAHEINNPLGFVRANVAFVREALQAPARRRGPDDAELEHALSDVELGVERIRRIVADLRGFAREDRDEPCGVAPAAALEEALRLSSLRTRGMRVTVHAPQPLASVRMCRKRLVQVLVNLLVNAADAVDEAEGDDRRWIEVTVEPRPGLVLFRVEDGGTGLSEEALRHLFEPFFTTKPQGAGTGLGLALAHEYATAVGGRLSARNGRGGGAVFELEVPLQNGEGGCGCGACGRDPARTPAPRLAAGG